MANMIDYLDWRGDIGFDVSPLCEIDALILCQLSYLNFRTILDGEFTRKGLPLSRLSELFFSAPDFETRKDVGALINAKTVNLLRLAGESRRFGPVRVCGYEDKIDLASEEQFAALTYTSAAGWNFVAYRGTDDTIVGWKEDFNLGYMDTVPAQQDALRYLERVASALKGDLYVGGHSKGGNLAIYAAAHAGPQAKKRLCAVYNNDGPGFQKEFFSSEAFKSIENIQHTFVPELSIVGMLFAHADGYVTVQSDQKGIMQHDPFSWHVAARHFVEEEDTNGESKFIGATVNKWIGELSTEQRELFIETMFSILRDTDATTNSEITANWGESVRKMLRAMTQLDSQTREAVFRTAQLLLKTAGQNASLLIHR